MKLKRHKTLNENSVDSNSGESSVKNTRQWFSFYAIPLRDFWKSNKSNRKMEDLYKLLARLYVKSNPGDEDRAASSVKNLFKREDKNTLPREYIRGVSALLLETDFYLRFFEIGLPHRLEVKNTKREARNSYLYLKTNYAEKIDTFWGRWIESYSLFYDSSHLSHEEISILFEKRFKDLVHNEGKEHFKIELERIHKEYDPQLSSLLFLRYNIINLFYKTSFLFNYRSFLKDILNEESESYISKSERETKIQNTIESLSITIKELETLINNPDFKNEFQEDLLMIQMHNQGNQFIGRFVSSFKNLSEKNQNNLLEKGDYFVYTMKPNPDSSKIYRIWYEYYEFLHLYRILEQFLSKGYYENAMDQCRKCLDHLDRLDEKLKGGFLRICIKIRYHRRTIHYIYHSIDAFLLESALDSNDGNQIQMNREAFNKKNDQFQRTISMISEVHDRIMN